MRINGISRKYACTVVRANRDEGLPVPKEQRSRRRTRRRRENRTDRGEEAGRGGKTKL